MTSEEPKQPEPKKRTQTIRAVKGMPDILPTEMAVWQLFEKHWMDVIRVYGYEEIGLPILEETLLFKRTVGEVTDIVEKEMFTFIDRDKDSICLRPEGTAGCVRASLEHGLIFHQTRRLWFRGPMFRHEKPQYGRYRQFHQFDVEAFGFRGPDIEVEHILMTHRFFKAFGIAEKLILEINSLGTPETRQEYKKDLKHYFTQFYKDLDEDNQRRLETNPLRILDSKQESLAAIIAEAPKSIDYLDAPSRQHFEKFQSLLSAVQIPYRINPRIVRGLDYYNQTVYEWVTDALGAQGTVCAGGRYDGLVTELGGREETPATGFAIGVERAILLKQKISAPIEGIFVEVYVISVGESAELEALKQVEALRTHCPQLRFWLNCGGGSFKNQFQRADKSGAKLALILGENEVNSKTISVKFLREEREQVSVAFTQLGQFLNQYFNERGKG